jgi:hypothetical protein
MQGIRPPRVSVAERIRFGFPGHAGSRRMKFACERRRSSTSPRPQAKRRSAKLIPALSCPGPEAERGIVGSNRTRRLPGAGLTSQRGSRDHRCRPSGHAPGGRSEVASQAMNQDDRDRSLASLIERGAELKRVLVSFALGPGRGQVRLASCAAGALAACRVESSVSCLPRPR